MQQRGRIKVVIVDSAFEDASVENMILKEINADVQFFHCKDEEEIVRIAKEANAIINNLLPMSKETISALDKLQLIVRCAVGYDNIDLKAATENKVVICNVPDYCTAEVADHTLGLILSLSRKIPWIDSYTKKGRADFSADWKNFAPIYRLNGKTAGIIGFGKIGREVAKRLKAFGLRILVYDPYLPQKIFENFGVAPVALEDLLKTSDIVSIHCPLTKDTYHLISKDKLGLMKKTAILVNVSRGPIVDEEALYEALKNNLIQSAALDVFEKEPLEKNSPFLKLKNVIITPHIAWYSEEAAIDSRKFASEEILRFFKGVKPKNIVNLEVLKYYPQLE